MNGDTIASLIGNGQLYVMAMGEITDGYDAHLYQVGPDNECILLSLEMFFRQQYICLSKHFTCIALPEHYPFLWCFCKLLHLV